jgi:Uma2 family endonuclease
LIGIPALEYLTEQEYLVFERASPEKHEYYKGEIFNMSGASRKHTVIESNIRGTLYNYLKGKKCREYGGNLRVNVNTESLYAYPDILVVCGEEKYMDDEFDTLTNPSIIFEILSPSTSEFDKGLKFELYRALESFKEYVLIDPNKIHIIHFQKNPDGSWLMKEYKSIEDMFTLVCIEMPLCLKDCYDGIDFTVSEK